MANGSITWQELEEEKKRLEEDFVKTQDGIKQLEVELGKQKSNLNALFGAAQEVDNLIVKAKEGLKSEARKVANGEK